MVQFENIRVAATLGGFLSAGKKAAKTLDLQTSLVELFKKYNSSLQHKTAISEVIPLSESVRDRLNGLQADAVEG